jgi:hypothetical protein
MDYRQKYLKYKQKYLDLKEQFGGDCIINKDGTLQEIDCSTVDNMSRFQCSQDKFECQKLLQNININITKLFIDHNDNITGYTSYIGTKFYRNEKKREDFTKVFIFLLNKLFEKITSHIKLDTPENKKVAFIYMFKICLEINIQIESDITLERLKQMESIYIPPNLDMLLEAIRKLIKRGEISIIFRDIHKIMPFDYNVLEYELKEKIKQQQQQPRS